MERRGEIGKVYRIGELAKEANISKRTIDYYSQIGLLTPVRSDSNYRLYEEQSIKILQLIAHYKKLNMPLEEIKEFIHLLKKEGQLNEDKINKHVQQITDIMHHLVAELNEIKPLIDKLDSKQKDFIASKISAQGLTLAQTLILFFG
ncbi:MerR family transcriptional regulator [Pseudoneobacillus sp. C159]